MRSLLPGSSPGPTTPAAPRPRFAAVAPRRLPLLLAAFAGAAFAQAPSPPTTQDAQEAYSRFATAFVARLADAHQTSPLTPGKISEINEFAHRQALRGCDERRPPEQDPFAPEPSPGDRPPPVVFHCTWDSGERISLTWIANTGSWVLSDDATAAAGAGMVLAGPRIEGPQVAAIPVTPLKDAPATVPDPVQTPVAVASYPVARQPVYMGTSLQAMPSPFVPPARNRPEPAAPAPAAAGGPMPSPYATGR